MSKYDPLWKFIASLKQKEIELSFAGIRSVLGFDIDHSFLTFKKELLQYGYEIGKISIKNKTVKINRTSKK